jgi:hypothetical protein
MAVLPNAAILAQVMKPPSPLTEFACVCYIGMHRTQLGSSALRADVCACCQLPLPSYSSS